MGFLLSPGESKFLTDHNNVKALRPTATTGTFRIEKLAGVAPDVRKYSIELKENLCL